MQPSRRNALVAGLGAFSAATFARFAAAQDGLAAARAALAPRGPVDQALASLAREDRFAGVALASIGGAPVLACAYGLADRERGVAHSLDTRFNIASAGKMFTAVAIGQLIERGVLALEDSAVRHRPDLADTLPASVTIADLLGHTSGLGSYFASPLWAERGGAIRNVEDYLALVRGERIAPDYDGGFRYSNSGYIVLGAIIEAVTGRDYYEHVRAHVFAPAGMTRTNYPVFGEAADDLAIGYENGCAMRPPSQCTPHPWAPIASAPGRGGPAGGGVSTAPDFDRFAQALRDGRLLGARLLARMRAERTRPDRPGGPLDAYGLGFGRLSVGGRMTWGHNGGTVGFAAQLDIVEDAPITLIVLTNQDGALRPAVAALRRALS